MTREQWIAGLERQYDRRLNQWASAKTDDERAGHAQLLERISEILRGLRAAS